MFDGLDRRGRDRRSTILVFDGEPMILDLLATVLQRDGYRVSTTRQSDEALQLLSNLSYDLVVTDLGVHENDGRRLVSEIRRVSPGTPIVAMTAYPAMEIVAFGEEHADAFLPKPFGIGELLSVVRRVLNGRAVSGAASTSSLRSVGGAPLLAANAP